MTTSSPEIAISYNWKEENNGPNAKAVDAICQRFEKLGIKFLIDKNGLRPGDDLREFMQRIGSSHFLCVFLSDGYLRSRNCMNELLIAWDQSKAKPAEFRDRVKVWIMRSAHDIFTPQGRIVYTEHWKHERDKLETLLKPHLADGSLGGEELENLRLHRQFAEKVNEILIFLANKLSPQDVSEFEQWVCDSFSSVCMTSADEGEPAGAQPQSSSTRPKSEASATTETAKTPLDEAELARRLREVYSERIREIERILTTKEVLRSELTQRFSLDPKLISPKQLTEKLWLRFHIEFLRSIGQFAQVYKDTELKAEVLDLASSVVFLSMCPEFAVGLKGSRPKQLHIPTEAKEGIAEMLLCWTHGNTLKLNPRNTAKAALAVPPEMKFETIQRDLMDELDISSLDPFAAEKLERLLQMKDDFGEPVYRIVDEAETNLISQIRAPGSPLAPLFLMIKRAGQSIRPGSEPLYDFGVERYMHEFTQLLPP